MENNIKTNEYQFNQIVKNSKTICEGLELPNMNEIIENKITKFYFTVRECLLAQISFNYLRVLISNYSDLRIPRNVYSELYDNFPFLLELGAYDKKKMLSACKKNIYPISYSIYQKGEEANMAYFLISGEV